jgi:hypothetical protein
MRDQEQGHVNIFNKLVVERRVRPSLFLPIFNMGAYAMGMNINLQIILLNILLNILQLILYFILCHSSSVIVN